jgi:hypothetical protein
MHQWMDALEIGHALGQCRDAGMLEMQGKNAGMQKCKNAEMQECKNR